MSKQITPSKSFEESLAKARASYGELRISRYACTSGGPGYTSGRSYVCVTHCAGMVTVWDDGGHQDTMPNACHARHFTTLE